MYLLNDVVDREEDRRHPVKSRRPFPVYGVFRYLYLVHRRDGGGSPAEMLVRDRPLLACVMLWAAAIVLIIYRPFGG